MISRMEATKSQTTPVPPNVIAALKAGFDAIANHILVILIPIALDMWIWLGPHLQIKQLLTQFLTLLNSSTAVDASQQSLLPTSDMIQSFAGHINLMVILRTYPVGVPSLMAGRLPIEIPTGLASGKPIFIDITSPALIILLWAGLAVIGLGAGTLYFTIVSQAALTGRVIWQQALRESPRTFLQVLSLTLLLGALILLLSVPATCVLSLLAFGGLPFGQIGLLLYAGFLIWMLFPLIFSPHGIIARHYNLLFAIRNSITLTRLILPVTAFLVMAVMVLSEGLDILWRVPTENSWLTLIGIVGHAFVTSALLATTFVFYRDAELYAQGVWEKMRAHSAKNIS